MLTEPRFPSSWRHFRRAAAETSMGKYITGSRSASASKIQRVFRPLPLPSSTTATGGGRCSIMAAAWRRRSRSSARVNPYSGSKVIASNSVVPSSSYRYIEGSSRWPTFPRLSLTASANSRSTPVCTVCTRIMLILHAPKSGVDVGEVGPEPVAKRSAQQSGVRPRGCTLEDIMFAIEETSRVTGIKRERLEAGQRMEDCRRPLPSVADQLGDAECAVSKRGRGHGDRIPSVPVKVSEPAIRPGIAPWIEPLSFTVHRPIGSPMKLHFGRQSLSGPACKGGRLFMGDVDRPIPWQRSLSPHASPTPLALVPPPQVRRLGAGTNEFKVIPVRDLVLAHGKCRDRHLTTLELVVPSELIARLT